jgi:hypothetical protein
MPEQFPSQHNNQDPQQGIRNTRSPLEVLNSLVRSEILIDQEDFFRQRFNVIDPQNPDNSQITVEFRGREELPITDKKEGEVHVVLTSDTKPLHTNMDRWGTWAEALTDSQHQSGVVLGQPTNDTAQAQSEKVWEVAANKQADRVILHGLGTPEGVVDVALQLAGAAIGFPEATSDLLKLRDEISSRKYSDETLKFMNTLFTVCYEITDHTTSNNVSHEAGLMLVALALAGSKEAGEAIAKAEKDFNIKKAALDLSERTTTDRATGEKTLPNHIAKAGEMVAPETIAAVKEAGLVVVHTTETRPLLGKVLRSTAEFNSGSNRQFPRDSIHFSLNHPVDSHMWGNFSGRPFTIVAPMAGMLENNGAPAAMADVDTYFITKPGEGLTLPEGTIIIEVASKPEAGTKIVQPDGSWMVNTEQLRSLAGIEQMATEIQELSGATENKYMPLPSLMWLSSALKVDGGLNIEQELLRVDFKPSESTSFNLLKPEEQTALLAKKADVEAIHKVFVEGGSIQALLEDADLLANNTTFNNLLSESLRKILVAAAIRKQGGKVVKGGAHYTFDSNFQAISNGLAKKIGVSTALHTYMPESDFEGAYRKALYDAQEKLSNSNREPHIADFNWPKYDSSSMWYWLSRSPAQTRMRAIQMGLLTYAKKRKLYQQPSYDDVNIVI